MELIPSLAAELAINAYPGRGIVIGRLKDGKSAVIAYFIMGRSRQQPQPRVQLGTAASSPKPRTPQAGGPSLIIYAPVRVLGHKTIVTNGDQTDTVYDALKKGKSFA